MIGYIGLGLLCLAYVTTLSKKYWPFVVINLVASILLTVHAVMIGDVPFIIVNGFVGLVLLIEFFQRKVWKHFLVSKRV
jgi:hypothetical protein